MATDKEKFQILSALIKSKHPGFSNKTKDQSFLFSKILGPIVGLFNKTFLTDYITTLGDTVYWPNQESMDSDWAWKVLAHEYVHICDNNRNHVLFPLKYGFPQVLAIFALGTLGVFWSLWCLLFLLFLVCLAPLPAPGRTWAELRGYTMTMAVEAIWYGLDVDSNFEDWISNQFTSMAYYRMDPNNTDIHTRIRVTAASVKDRSILLPEENQPFRDVHKMLVDLGEIPAEK
jgi:hypothetical protein